MPVSADLLPRPALQEGWEEAPVEAHFVARPDERATDARLYLSEIAPGSFQAVSLRHESFPRALRALAAYVPDGRGVLRQRLRDDLSLVSVASGSGRFGRTRVFAVARLTRRLVAYLELDLAGRDNARATKATVRLLERVQGALAGRMPGRILEGVIPAALWLGALAATAGAIAISYSQTTTTVAVIYGGLCLFALACVGALIAGFTIAGRNVAHAQPGDSLITLWRHPWILATPATHMPVPLATIAILFRVSHGDLPLTFLYWTAMVAGVLVIVLGSNHRLLAQVGNLRAPGPVPGGRGWEPVSVLPPSFPELPAGRVTEILAEVGGGATAAVVLPTSAREPEWTRFNAVARSWNSQAGTVSARAHQVWDERIETIVEVMLGDRIVVVESVGGLEETWGAVRRLTDLLASRPEVPPRPSGPRAFLTYSLAPVWAQFFLTVYFWIGALAFRGQGLPRVRLYLAACVLMLILAPLYLAVLNRIAVVRPHYFVFEPAEVLRKARRGRALTLAILLPLMIPVAALNDIYRFNPPAHSLAALTWFAIGLAVAAVLTSARAARVYREAKEAQARLRAVK